MATIDVLKSSSFGHRTAEEEHDHLQEYFVETEQWRRVFSGEIDIIYGPKGSGKSAIYSLILKNENSLFDKKIIVVSGENPKGAAVFGGIANDHPNNESEFINLWKLYILTLTTQAIKEYGIESAFTDEVIASLEDADLLPSAFTLSKALKYAFDYIKRIGRKISGVEGEVAVDPITGASTMKGKILFSEPSIERAKLGAISVDELMAKANTGLKEAGYSIWILLDRLDFAFSNDPTFEALALRALFKFYLDTKQLTNIRPKIFLRSDIWSNITEYGFREASHIEISLTIQ